MKKRIAMLLYTAILTLFLAVAPAIASAGPFSPIAVETYTYGPFDEPRVNRVYQLSATDDSSCISTEDFEQGGRRYCLLEITAANTDHKTVTYTAVFGSVELVGQACSQALHTADYNLGLLSCVGGAILVAANIKCKEVD